MSEKERKDDTQWIERIRRRLDEDVAQLDGATLSRLRQARQRALSAAAQGGRPRWRTRWLSGRPAGDWLVPAGAFASIVATAFALTLMVAEPENDLTREVDDLDLLTVGEELELYENLEFYRWLENHEQTG
jgi:hypothetical protein